MTSAERREGRYQRRVALRAEKKARNCAQYDDYDAVFSFAHLYQAYRKCRQNVAWKASVQKYIATAPLNVYQTYRRLMAGTYKSPGFFEFDLVERGKKRHIRSTIIGERVVQRCLCDNALVPMLHRTFIHDNGASMTDKGYSFAVRRLGQHLHEHYRKHGQEGYILLFDFSKFFDRVSHAVIERIIRKNFTDRRLIRIIGHFVRMFGPIGLGLGSQISQVLALASANELDHAIKELLRIHASARYMDDGYLIHGSKAYLQRCLSLVQEVCDKLEITLNPKKTQIVKLAHGFTWLQIRVFLTPTGKIVKKMPRKGITKMRRKLKKLRRKLDAGEITREDVWTSWQSWRSHAERFDAWHTLQSMGQLYDELFVFTEDFYYDLPESA